MMRELLNAKLACTWCFKTARWGPHRAVVMEMVRKLVLVGVFPMQSPLVPFLEDGTLNHHSPIIVTQVRKAYLCQLSEMMPIYSIHIT